MWNNIIMLSIPPAVHFRIPRIPSIPLSTNSLYTSFPLQFCYSSATMVVLKSTAIYILYNELWCNST